MRETHLEKTQERGEGGGGQKELMGEEMPKKKKGEGKTFAFDLRAKEKEKLSSSPPSSKLLQL